MNELYNKYEQEIKVLFSRYPQDQKRSAIMPLLFLAQRETGYVSREAITQVAELTETSDTDVASVLGFYSLFQEEPGGRYRIQVCTDLPCALRGSETYLKQLCERLDVSVGQTTSDGMFTVEAVKCLAACHRAPMFQLQGDGEIKYYEDQSIEKTMQVVDVLRQKAADQKEAGHG